MKELDDNLSSSSFCSLMKKVIHFSLKSNQMVVTDQFRYIVWMEEDDDYGNNAELACKTSGAYT